MLLGVAVVDLVVLVAAVVLAWKSRLALDFWPTGIDHSAALSSTVGPWIVVAWMVLLATHGAYSIRLFGYGPEEFKAVFMASFLTLGVVGMGFYLLDMDLSRGFTLLTFLYGIPLLLLERYAARKILHRLRSKGHLQQKVLVVGGPSAVGQLAEVLHRAQHTGYRVVGACVPHGITVESDDFPVPLLGGIQDTRTLCERLDADTVLVAHDAYSSPYELRRVAWDLEDSDVDLIVVPSLTDVAGPRIHMRPVAGLPLLHVEGPQVDEAAGVAKRAFDLFVALAALAVLGPVMFAVVVAIKLEDGGPVFFWQRRVGRHGEEFEMLKFRSMVTDAERRLEEVQHLNEAEGVLFKVREDPRITTVGRFIRKYSLDELPQLINVLVGQMSLVGPRPPLPKEVANYEDDVRRRLLVRPGMTGLWQVSGRSELSWDEAVRLDLYYVDNWSMVTDLVIMAKTIKAVLASRGAY